MADYTNYDFFNTTPATIDPGVTGWTRAGDSGWYYNAETKRWAAPGTHVTSPYSGMDESERAAYSQAAPNGALVPQGITGTETGWGTETPNLIEKGYESSQSFFDKLMETVMPMIPYVQGAALMAPLGAALSSAAGFGGGTAAGTAGGLLSTEAVASSGLTASELAAGLAAEGITGLPAVTAGMTAAEYAAACNAAWATGAATGGAAYGLSDIPATLGKQAATSTLTDYIAPAAETATAGTGAVEGLGGAGSVFGSASIPVDTSLALSTGAGAVAPEAATGILGTGITAGEVVSAIPAVGGVISALTGGNSDQTASTSSTTNTLPSYVQGSAEQIWNDYINDFYGIKERAETDAAYKKTADDTYLSEATASLSPYQKQLQDILNQQSTGTGYYAPVSFGFGGKQMTSFVPKMNKATAMESLTTGKESANVSAGLAELKNTLAKQNLPGAAADTYSAKLSDLMKYVTSGNKTTTESATVPGESDWTTILKGLTSGASIYSSLFGTSK
jgi:hypothetical protein